MTASGCNGGEHPGCSNGVVFGADGVCHSVSGVRANRLLAWVLLLWRMSYPEDGIVDSPEVIAAGTAVLRGAAPGGVTQSAVHVAPRRSERPHPLITTECGNGRGDARSLPPGAAAANSDAMQGGLASHAATEHGSL